MTKMFGLFVSTAATHADALEFFKPDRNNASVPLNPYGDGHSSNSPIIALGEAWAYHIGHFLADQRYGVNASCHIEQPGLGVCPNPPLNTNRSNLLVLENFDPNYTPDPFRWIPKGLMEDLIDDTPGETIVNDQVSGYSTSQIFGALQSDVTSVPQYKSKLLQLYGTAQQNQVNNLFASYHY